MTLFDFTPVDAANVNNTPRKILKFVRAKLCASFLDDRHCYEFIEFSSFFEEFGIKMDNDFIEFQDFVEDFFNLELEFEIDEEFENAEEIILEEIDESEIVDESLFSFQEIHENNPVLKSLGVR